MVIFVFGRMFFLCSWICFYSFRGFGGLGFYVVFFLFCVLEFGIFFKFCIKEFLYFFMEIVGIFLLVLFLFFGFFIYEVNVLIFL